MPSRNLVILSIVTVISIFCYAAHRRIRDAVVVADALNLIHDQYIDPVDDRELLLAALAGLTKGLDPYSEFIPLDQYEQLQSTMSGEFAGIGIYVDMPQADGPVTVVTPLVGSPALQAGMQAGDQIIEIDGENVASLGLTEVSRRLKGPVGTKVELIVRRDGDPVPLTVRRDNIRMESVVGFSRRPDQSWNYQMPSDPTVYYTRLTTFGEKTPQELRDVVRQIGNDATGLILDLRGNGGGLLDTAVEICDLFIAGGVVVSTEIRGGVIEYRYRVGNDVAVRESLPIVVMIDQNSASASEIVAAAMQDRGRATIVGTRSFGKGTVQNVLPLEVGRSALKLTVARYLRPSGENIHRGKEDAPEDVWGVSPKPANTVPLSDDQQQALFLDWRRRAYPFAAEPIDGGDAENASDEATPESLRVVAPEEDDETGVDQPPPAAGELPATPSETDGSRQADSVEPSLRNDPQLLRALQILRQARPSVTAEAA